MSSIAVSTIDDVGAFSDVAKLDVTAGAAVSHTISAGMQGLFIQNTGEYVCWFGGSTVNATNKRGNILMPREKILLRKCRSTCQIYFQCESGGTTTIGIFEYA